MSKHYCQFLGAGDFIDLIKEIGEWGSSGLFTSTDCQIKLLPVCLIIHHKITALLTPHPHGRGVMLNKAIPV
ncbi:hypothetical protein [Nostoc sp. NZL]|uniref:hypothetical protein n=1 Tax=Nostoc sp. NZL TaxID=2650612 RepID=UPI0018C6CFBD|nr:hypothetical protein [Nostoc sp. NZL]MBG1243991.1 hypothetical protein [Nostoc sp. NZL]